MPKLRSLNEKEKVVAIKSLPIFQILFICIGIIVTIYLNGTMDWLHHSISYLAVIGKAAVSLAITVLSAVALGYPFVVFSMWVLHGREAVLSSRGRRRAHFIFFTLAYLCISIVALTPTTKSHNTVNFYVHHIAAVGYFLLFPFGALALSMSLDGRYYRFKDRTVAYFILYFSAVPLLFALTGGILLPELVCMILIGLWSLSLAQVVVKKILMSTLKDEELVSIP